MTYRVEIEGLEITPGNFGDFVKHKDRFEWTGTIIGLNGQFVTVRPWLATSAEYDEAINPDDLRWN